MAKAGRPDPPKALGKDGRRLWRAIIAALDADWQLDHRELHLLERAAKIEDRLAELDAAIDADGPMALGSKGQPVAHPGLQESRQLALAQHRLLCDLELVDPDKRRDPIVSVRARRAARARWDKPTKLAVGSE
jgi:P27 family predicted phage terminase small subunit